MTLVKVPNFQSGRSGVADADADMQVESAGEIVVSIHNPWMPLQFQHNRGHPMPLLPGVVPLLLPHRYATRLASILIGL